MNQAAYLGMARGGEAPSEPQAQAPTLSGREDLERMLESTSQPLTQDNDQKKKFLDYTDLGFAGGGEAHDDAAQDRAQMLGILREKKLIKRQGGRAFAEGGIADAPEPPKKIPGKDVLHRAPLGSVKHMAIPVLHTTIVIGVVPKKGKGKAQKKADGGRLETAPNFPDTPPRKPHAIPPKRGLKPRGVGLARKGWGRAGR